MGVTKKPERRSLSIVKKNKAKNLFVLIATVYLFLFGTEGLSRAADLPKEIKLGVIIPLTGYLESIGTAAQRGVLMAVDHINRNGGIKSMNGAKIKIFFGDDEGMPNVAVTQAERLIKREKVDSLIGAYTSSCSFPVTQVAEKHKIPIVVPASARDEITERGFKYTFRLCDKASGYSKVGLDVLKYFSEKANIPIKTVALLYEDSAWGQSYTRSVKKILPNYGYKIVADLPYSSRTEDIFPAIVKLKAANPDAVIQVSYTLDAILITKTMHELDFNCKGIITGGSGHTVPAYYDSVGNLNEYIFVTEPFSSLLPFGEVKERAKEFEERFKTPMDMYGAFFYTATYIVANAFEMAGSVDKAKVRDALSKVNIKVGQKGNLFIYDATFDENGQAPATTAICQWRKGKKEIVYPEKGAILKPVFPMPPWAKRK